ncbi:hypothetical protein E2C01_102410 [Portunus trituberculatus]|uniref:Uncharacterized protein n=1 Tax=Portunus trituberculatus TaxID=210409 RepID=A0A5B7KD35_PORTR|nr:hypothetical protein [Portunus trituberculatus]
MEPSMKTEPDSRMNQHVASSPRLWNTHNTIIKANSGTINTFLFSLISSIFLPFRLRSLRVAPRPSSCPSISPVRHWDVSPMFIRVLISGDEMWR